MKYILFMIALAGVIPAGFLMANSRRLMWLGMLLVMATVLIFESTSINFMSHETYRGTSRGMEVSLAYLCALAVLLGVVIRKGKIRIMPDMGCRLFALYFLVCLLSIVNAANALLSFFEIWKMLMLYLLYLAVWNYMSLTDDVEVIAYGLAVVVLLNFPEVVWGYFHGVYQSRGVFPHQNSMGMFMAMAGCLFLARLFSSPDWNSRVFNGVIFSVASVSLLLTYSRGAIACYPIGCGLTLMATLVYEFNRWKLIITLLLAIAGITVVAVFTPRIIERFERAPERSKLTRIELANSALYMMNDNLFGVGINNWGIKINPPSPYSRAEMNPNLQYYGEKDGIVETIYLLVGAECGYGGLVMLLIWFAYYWLVALRLLKKLAHSPRFYFAAGALGGLLANYLQSILEWVLKQQVNFMLLILVFAVLGYLNVFYRQEKRRMQKQEEEEVMS